MPRALLSFTNDFIDVVHLVHLVNLVNWVLAILDNFNQNSIAFTKSIANVREKLRVDKTNFPVGEKKI